MTRRFDLINSSEPCHGRGGLYQVWLHTVTLGVGPAEPTPIAITQAGRDVTEVDARLGWPAQPGIGDMLRFMQVFDTERSRRRIHPHQIVTASLIRVCNRPYHEGGPLHWTGAHRGWLEAVTRAVLLPPSTGDVPRYEPEHPVNVDINGVGALAFAREASAVSSSVVSVPLTRAEMNDAELIPVAVPVTLRTDPALGAFALLHMQGEGGSPLERVFRHTP